MNWKNTELETAGAIMDALFACNTIEEANEFADAYRAQYPEVADKNLEFGISYWGKDDDQIAKFYAWLGINTNTQEQINICESLISNA